MITPTELRLLTCARERDLAGMQKIVKAGVRIDAANDDGWNALLLCAKECFHEGVEFLLESGADIQARKRDGFNALHLIIQRAESFTPAVAGGAGARESKRARPSPSDAIRKGLGDDARDYQDCVRLARLLLGRGIDADARTVLARQTPLSHAASRGTPEIVELLAESGRAALDSQDKDGVSPLHYAARNGHAASVCLLVKAGADVNVRELFGFTPLHEAAENGHLEVARVLLAAGANRTAGLQRVFEGYPVGSMPFDLALARGHTALLGLLSGDESPGPIELPKRKREPAAKKSTPPPTKPAVKKPAVKKPAVKKPAAKKPAAKKPAVKKLR